MKAFHHFMYRFQRNLMGCFFRRTGMNCIMCIALFHNNNALCIDRFASFVYVLFLFPSIETRCTITLIKWCNFSYKWIFINTLHHLCCYSDWIKLLLLNQFRLLIHFMRPSVGVLKVKHSCFIAELMQSIKKRNCKRFYLLLSVQWITIDASIHR